MMNNIAKKRIMERLKEALDQEHLTKARATKLLGIKHPNYTVWATNPKTWHMCSKSAWDRFREWSNSGVSIEVFGAKSSPGETAFDLIEKTEKEEAEPGKHPEWKPKSIYMLELHEMLEVSDPSNKADAYRNFLVTKVPGGWLYLSKMGGSPCYVPDKRGKTINGPS